MDTALDVDVDENLIYYLKGEHINIVMLISVFVKRGINLTAAYILYISALEHVTFYINFFSLFNLLIKFIDLLSMTNRAQIHKL